MKKPIVALLASWVLAGCATTHSTMTLTPRDNGREIAVKTGAVLVVELPANHTTGYCWKPHGAEKLILESLKPI